jgi:hypothetical protein
MRRKKKVSDLRFKLLETQSKQLFAKHWRAYCEICVQTVKDLWVMGLWNKANFSGRPKSL